MSSDNSIYLDKTVVIIPSLNPDEKFTRTVGGMISAGFSRFVVVDDGSDKKHKEPFEKAKQDCNAEVIVHDVNLGKGQALKDAFSYVNDNMSDVDAVITIDGDGQHSPDDAVNLALRLQENPGEVVFGCRSFKGKQVPLHNKLGNKITSLLFRVLFGMKLSDTQTGLRGIPQRYLKCFAEEVEGTRFEYESNMLLYMNENKIPYSEVPIETLYIEENKSSHFRPFRDSVRIYKYIIAKSSVLRFIISGCTCTLLDLVLYGILNSAFRGMENVWLQNFICNGLARVCSAVVNFFWNRSWVFRSTQKASNGILKYFAISAGKMLISWLIQTPIFDALHIEGFLRTVIKCIVDMVLALVSYFVQKKWVFKK